MKYLLLFHYNNSCKIALHCKVVSILPVLLFYYIGYGYIFQPLVVILRTLKHIKYEITTEAPVLVGQLQFCTFQQPEDDRYWLKHVTKCL
jgi:hypothetical protein